MFQRIQLYRKLSADNNYADVQFNPTNGGLKATHLYHTFDKDTARYEQAARDVLFQKGHQVILESEVGGYRIKHPDGSLNDHVFDIKVVMGFGKHTLQRHLGNARVQGCEYVVLYYPVERPFNEEELNRHYQRYLGTVRAHHLQDTITQIWVIEGNNVIVFCK